MPSITPIASTGDGWMYYDAPATSWATARAAANANGFGSGTTTYAACGIFYGTNNGCYRLMLPFDTSAIPDTATVGSVSLRMVPSAVYGAGQEVQVVTVDFTSITAANYAIAHYGASALGAFAAAQTVDTPADASVTGLTINKTGMTYLGLRGKRDMDNTTPPDAAYAIWYSADSMAGTPAGAYRPVLTVNYTDSSWFPARHLWTAEG